MSSYKKIELTFSNEEWCHLELIVEEFGESLDGFIDRHLRKMSSNIKETTSDDIVEKRSAHKSLTPRQSKTITAISKKYGIPPAAVVSRLIIYPALKAFYDRNGY